MIRSSYTSKKWQNLTSSSRLRPSCLATCREVIVPTNTKKLNFPTNTFTALSSFRSSSIKRSTAAVKKMKIYHKEWSDRRFKRTKYRGWKILVVFRCHSLLRTKMVPPIDLRQQPSGLNNNLNLFGKLGDLIPTF